MTTMEQLKRNGYRRIFLEYEAVITIISITKPNPDIYKVTVSAILKDDSNKSIIGEHTSMKTINVSSLQEDLQQFRIDVVKELKNKFDSVMALPNFRKQQVAETFINAVKSDIEGYMNE